MLASNPLVRFKLVFLGMRGSVVRDEIHKGDQYRIENSERPIFGVFGREVYLGRPLAAPEKAESMLACISLSGPTVLLSVAPLSSGWRYVPPALVL